MRSSKEGHALADWPDGAPQSFPTLPLSSYGWAPSPFCRRPVASHREAKVQASGDATLLPHYSSWRWLACDRRISGTGIVLDVFLSSQIPAQTTAFLPPITEMVSQMRVRVAVSRLAPCFTVAIRLRHSWLHSTQDLAPCSSPHSARLTAPACRLSFYRSVRVWVRA